MKNIFLAMLTLVLISCSNEKPKVEEKPETIEEKVEVVKPTKFSIELRLKYSESEEIKLSASNIFINNSRTMNISVIQKMGKTESFKTVVLDFPENINPDEQITLSLGTKKPKSIEFENIKIKNGEIEFDLTPQELNDYFSFNKFIVYSQETGIITTKKVDGRHNPILLLRKKIIDKFEF
jgi:ASC-1-like (ASCH) protein